MYVYFTKNIMRRINKITAVKMQIWHEYVIGVFIGFLLGFFMALTFSRKGYKYKKG